jgi:glycosyltransferase involved in cell wall biosynthesis
MPKVALIYDSPGWAFHHIAIQVANHAPSDLEFTLIPSGQPKSWRAFHANIAGDFDWYHYLWRVATESIVGNGATNISTSVYDHQYLEDLRFTHNLLNNVPFYVASSKLHVEYSHLFPDRFIRTCQDGVDANFFYPSNTPGKHSTIKVGWVGNATWGHNSNKGFNQIFAKSIEKAQAMGLPVEAHIADASVTKRTHTEMSDFYQEIDVLLCTSLNEGTPNPILEAAASGRAWISTDVGIVPELAGPLQRDFIVDRDVDSFVSALQRLNENRSLIQMLGEENRANVESKWKWSDRAPAIVEFIRNSISQKT